MIRQKENLMQPTQPVQPANLDFTANPQPEPVVQPVTPQVDPAFSSLQNDVNEIKEAIKNFTPAPLPEPVAPTPVEEKKYDQWGAVFEDVDKRVEAKLAEREQQAEAANQQVTEQEKKNQEYIDGTLNQLRQAGYVPPVVDQFNPNDPGKQAENELIGYAVHVLGSADLVKAAQELKFRHDAGFKFDYQTKQFIQVSQPNPNDPNAGMFGNLPQTPDQLPPAQQFQQPYPQQPVGPQNPYMPKQYPAGFNAPVSNGATYQGVQGQVPSLKALRNNSYDSLVENFNRTQ